MHNYRLAMAIFICCILSIRTFPDEVTLDDGSKIIGTIIKLQSGNLVLQTKHAGKLTIKMGGVVGISTDGERGIALNDLAPRVGALEFKDGKQQLVESGQATPIAPAEMSLLWNVGEKMPEPARLWNGRAELSLIGSNGNTERLSYLARTEATRKTDDNKLLLYFQSHYAESNGERSNNESKLGGRYEWKFTDKWSAYTRGEFEKDEFEELDLRTTLVLGMSYTILETKRQELSARLGLGYLNESFEDSPSEDDVIIDLGYNYSLNVLEWTKITHDLTYYSGLDEPTEAFRLVVNTAGEVPLSTSQRWKIRVGVKHEYDDAPLPGIEGLDTTYFLNLLYDW